VTEFFPEPFLDRKFVQVSMPEIIDNLRMNITST